ncbi:hypothetical protein [Salipiger aestuarii]|uniref:hypothetical protein n=1 Tax=Salipiger aestuarii TaxID=568098 RepID=UPI00025B63C5|nr:hypothetical protein [Salipiger aestuarii]EIE52445.1 hypothetical protein C357_03675 [Citreicella sp. 357]KAA8608501.1 hypothetical protein AL037_16985 [Salipiger aestuarii]
MTSDHIPRIIAFGDTGLACHGCSGRGIGPGTVFGSACARALPCAGRTGLPVRPVHGHRERLSALRAPHNECGATLVHALDAR